MHVAADEHVTLLHPGEPPLPLPLAPLLLPPLLLLEEEEDEEEDDEDDEDEDDALPPLLPLPLLPLLPPPSSIGPFAPESPQLVMACVPLQAASAPALTTQARSE